MQKISQWTAEEVMNLMRERDSLLYLKYVRLSNGEYRFGDATSMAVEHKGLASGDQPVSAAMVKIYPDGLMVEGNSMTLQMGPAKDDEDNLSQLFGLPIKSRYL